MLDLMDPGLILGSLTIAGGIALKVADYRRDKKRKPIDWHWVREQEMEVWGEYFSELQCEPGCKKCKALPKTIKAPIPPKGKGGSAVASPNYGGAPRVSACACNGNNLCGKHFVDKKKREIAKKQAHDNGLQVMQLCKVCENRRVAGTDTCNVCRVKSKITNHCVRCGIDISMHNTSKMCYACGVTVAGNRDERRRVEFPSGVKVLRPRNVPSFATARTYYDNKINMHPVGLEWTWQYDDTGEMKFRQPLNIEQMDLESGNGVIAKIMNIYDPDSGKHLGTVRKTRDGRTLLSGECPDHAVHQLTGGCGCWDEGGPVHDELMERRRKKLWNGTYDDKTVNELLELGFSNEEIWRYVKRVPEEMSGS